MPTRLPVTMRGSAAPRRGASTSIGPSTSELPFSDRPMPSACVSLPGPEQSSSGRQAAPLVHLLDAVDRLERADQHRGPHPLASLTAFSREWTP